jgi:aminoglycoside/choline kinase family phosphotransferase
MQLFPQWFVTQLLGYSLSQSETKMLEQLFQQLIQSAQEQPQYFVHRDYHSRNLILNDVGAPGVIDFQDAVVGPMTYDVISLVKDCYVRWPVAAVERWLMVYANMAIEMGLLPPMPKEKFLRWSDWMGLQRHLKVLGIFTRLYLRDDKPNYLHDLPLVMRYTIEVLERYPQFSNVEHWFKQQLLPVIEQQHWYVDYRTAGDQ